MKTHYDITIVGGGPSGIALAMMLEKTGKSILLIEREETLGGCWRVEWQDDKYFTEHSPHILTNKYHKFFKLCSLLNVKNTFKNAYKQASSLQSVYLGKNVIGNLTLVDILKIIYGLIISRFIENIQTIKEFSEQLSETGKKAFYMVSVAIASTPDKVMMQDLFDEMINVPPQLQQLREPELWIQKAEKYFRSSPNIDLHLNGTVTHIERSEGNGGYRLNGGSGTTTPSWSTDECILALPPIALLNIIDKSDDEVRNNWRPYDEFVEWANNSNYASIGFQMHFTTDVSFPDEWCWSCTREWNIISLPTSEYVETFSKDPSIKTVLSCTIIDQSNFSSYLNKHVYECSLNEIENEVLRQLSIPFPKVFTFYDGIEKINGRYMSKDTGFVRQKYGVIPFTGKLKNLHIVSTVNQKGIVYMETALTSCYDFIKKNHSGYEKILNSENRNDGVICVFIIYAICIFMSIYFYCKICKLL